MNGRSSGVRGLAFGGLMAAMAVVCALVPLLGYFMPIPLTLAYVRFGGRIAGMTAVVASLFVLMFIGPVQLVWLLPVGIAPGLVFGYGFRHQLKPAIFSAVAVAVLFLAWAGTYTSFRVGLLGGQDPLFGALDSPEVQTQMDKMWDQYELIIQQQPDPKQRESALQQVQYMRENLMPLLKRLVPGLLFMTALFSTWMNYWLCRWILPRFGHAVPQLVPFREWHMPWWLALGYIPLFMAGNYFTTAQGPVTGWAEVLMNVSYPLSTIFQLVGLGVAYGFLRMREVPKPAAIIFTLLGLFLFGPYGQLLYIMLAVWDAIFDFRGLGHGLLKRPT